MRTIEKGRIDIVELGDVQFSRTVFEVAGPTGDEGGCRTRFVVPLPRLRQVALVAADLDQACAELERALEVRSPFRDPGVAAFGLVNAVYELGDSFVEVVSPSAEGTTASRYLERRGGDAGYMAIFQVADTAATRARVAELGVRTVWQADLADIAGTHLHPVDVPGAIVSFDTPEPPESWRWGGPRWTGGAPADAQATEAGVLALTVRLLDPHAGAARWGAVLGADVEGAELVLAGGAQRIRFERAADRRWEGIAEVVVAGRTVDAIVCGVRFVGRG